MNPPLDKITITQPFGEKNSTYTRTGHHVGVDLRAEVGTTVYAPEKCSVVNTYSKHPIFGNGFELKGKYTWRFMHMDTLEDTLSFNAGDTLGTTGNTGLSTGPHLHIDCRKGDIEDATPENFRDIFLDPIKLMEKRYISMAMIVPDSWGSIDEKVQELKDFFYPYYNLDVTIIKKNIVNPPIQVQGNSAWIADSYIKEELFPLIVENDFITADILCVLHEEQPSTNWGIRRDRIDGVSPIQIFMGEHTSRPVQNSNPPLRESVFVPYIAHEVCHALFELHNVSDPVDGKENGVHWFDYNEQDLKSAVRYVYQHSTKYPPFKLEQISYLLKRKNILSSLLLWINSFLGRK